MQYTYLLIDLGCLLIPFLCSFYKKHPFYKEWKPFFISCIVVATFFLVWDEIFTKLGFWGFNPDYLTGVYVGHLPIEEILFFICIPYACSFTFFAFQYLLKNKQHSIRLKKTNYILALFLLGLSILNYNRWYTFLTFLFLGIFLLYLHAKKINLFYYYLAFATILPFFFISNGILTGSFLKAPIVWYNNTENLGIRMFTIPVEDTFYGMLLIFSNLYLHQYFKQKLNAES
ncbi:lycopene cyclase domain-containing protein [Wenyingzhuangia heitensis]|uniref:Lycopene cyclase domain-containing protein n=1 Tax=Wenyingzhuangia heitensis TaxID=1487859 RepID=A0ABX0UBE3_9FLAO|nr:lycopene cyclase domain-containing protein [Wenyingzhuangia heitensis]NIJ44786.1 lycopene cyclase domain-containing protein [Wenyingzhuangia heitensis]